MAETGLHVIGWDHHRTPVDLRERIAVSESRRADVLAALCALPSVEEALILSTCNRSEVYVAGRDCACAVQQCFAELNGVPDADLRPSAYVCCDSDAVRHLFRVVSSLESLVLGEYQIAHQVKEAWNGAREGGFAKRQLDPLFQQALAVGKKVRNETAIGKHKLSVASVAVDLARHIHGDLSKARLLVCGAGEMADLAIQHLIAHGVKTVGIVNRSSDRAREMAAHHEQVSASVHDWETLPALLGQHDIVLSSTAAPHPVILAEHVKAALKKRRQPLMLIDLAVPRDVEPSVGDLDDAYRYDIDDLDRIVAGNRQLRDDELGDAEALVDHEVSSWLRRSRRSTNRLLADLSRFFDEVVDLEHDRLLKKVPAAAELNGELRYGLQRVANKLNHRLLRWVKEHADEPETLAMLNEILGLEAGDND